jgi:hypothetical protein
VLWPVDNGRVLMGANDTTIDTLSIGDFYQTLDARLAEASTALAGLSTEPRGEPALGQFFDAQQTAVRHEALRDEYLTRLRRLVDAVIAAQTATGAIIDSYHDIEALNTANAADVADALQPVRDALDGSKHRA